MIFKKIKQHVRAFLKEAVRPLFSEERQVFLNDIRPVFGEEIHNHLSQAARRSNPYLMRDHLPHPAEVKAYWLALKQNTAIQAFDDIGMSVFSQNNEDGILLYLFSRIGFTSRKSIEVGCNMDNTTLGVPEGNSINLIVNFNFHGLIIDMDPEQMNGVRYFFATCLTTKHFHQAKDTVHRRIAGDFYSPVLLPSEVTVANINALAEDNGFAGDIDFMSIDIDGNDVHVFEAITVVSARVLVMEVNNRLPFEESIFAGPLPAWELNNQTTAFRQSCASSLRKIVESVTARGYVFVGMNNHLINAFFVRKDVFTGSGLQEATVEDFINHHLRPPESYAFEAGKANG